MLLPPAVDGEQYVLTQQAADLMGVAKSTVSRWKARGWLKPIPQSPPGKPIYRLDDVREAERLAREQYIVHNNGSDAQVRRMRGVEIGDDI